ncbi:MAG: hypothetical protein OES47_01040 [Acidobacteriota bacterium]|nr:hypothetical protein [Acidobacteriota bacterium]
MRGADSFQELEASELFCDRCQRATPVRKRLLLVLPTGKRYDFLCTVCGNSVGSKHDDDTEAFSVLEPS